MRFDAATLEIPVLSPVWQQAWLCAIAFIASLAIFITDIIWWQKGLLWLALIMFTGHEWRGVQRIPVMLIRHPNGRWEGIRHSYKPQTPQKYRLAGHFQPGDRSLTMLLRDSCNRPVRVWIHRSTCPEDDWRRLLVLLRWPPPDASE